MRHDQPWTLLTLALLNIFVLVMALTAYDVIATRPPDPVPSPPIHAAGAPEPVEPGAAEVDTTRLAEQLDDRMADSGIDDGLSGYVVLADPDAADEEPVFELDADEAAVPASTTKIATALAVLATAGPDEQLTTRVVGEVNEVDNAENADEAAEIVLVGGGDPTMTETPDPDAYPSPASLWELAADTAAQLQEAGVDTVRLGYDTSLYTGSGTGPGWQPNYVTEGSVASVHALMHDGGRVDADDFYGDRVDDPPRATATAFANQLEDAGISVEEEPEKQQATDIEDQATELAAVDSAPISALVEYMLITSDNNVAEALAHQVALAGGEDQASFATAADAMEETLAELGITEVDLSDGSGLSVDNEISARNLVDMLRVAADSEHPELRSSVSGLPIAHFTGTLSGRYSEDSDAAAGAGVVRAKTGTLSGVSTLAGTVYDDAGRLLLFAFMANDPMAAGSTLDEFAAAVADCSC